MPRMRKGGFGLRLIPSKLIKNEITPLFVDNEALIISDGTHAHIGSLTADKERFMPWKAIAGDTLADGSRH
jgi:type I site-specific restriction-modification system R (restriction) subunit